MYTDMKMKTVLVMEMTLHTKNRKCFYLEVGMWLLRKVRYVTLHSNWVTKL